MLFNSYIFIFVFLPLVLFGYYIFNHFRRYQSAKLLLIIMSFGFTDISM